MANKRVNLIIALRDGVSSGLSGIRAGIGRTVASFKRLAIAGVAATTAIVGGLVALAKSYAQQESANNRLAATFKAAGESGARAVVQWGAWATSIQRVTTLGDEQIMSLVSLGKTMGITNSQLAGATKGAIGLSKAFGIDLNSAMKMTALALQGEYTMLQRYIPELRSANSEAEKAAIVQRAMARGFEVAKEELNTISGAWAALKGVVVDAMQAAGGAIFGDGGLVKGLKAIKERIIELEESGAIARWAAQAKEAFEMISNAAKIIFSGDRESRVKVMEAVGGVIKAAFLDAAIGAMNLMVTMAPKIGRVIGDAFQAVMERPVRGLVARNQARRELAGVLEKEGVGDRKNRTAILARNDAAVEQRSREILQAQEEKLGKQYVTAADNTREAYKNLGDVVESESKHLNEITKKAVTQSGAGSGAGLGGLGAGLSSKKSAPVEDIAKAVAAEEKKKKRGGPAGEFWGVVGTPLAKLAEIVSNPNFEGDKMAALKEAKEVALWRLQEHKNLGEGQEKLDTGLTASTSFKYRDETLKLERERQKEYQNYISTIGSLMKQLESGAVGEETDKLVDIGNKQISLLTTISERVGGVV